MIYIGGLTPGGSVPKKKNTMLTTYHGGVQLASNLMNNLFAGRRAKKQYQFDKKLMEKQNQMNIDMWNLQNEYNSPIAQMQRYQDAGLNPNLLYGNGQSSSGNATSSPEQQLARYEAPQFEVQGLENIASTFLQERNLKMQEDYNDARVNLLRQQTISESMSHTTRLIDNLNKQLESYKRSGDMQLFWDTYEDKKRAIGLQNDNLIAQRELTMSTKDKLDTENQIGKYNLEVQLPLQSEEIRRRIYISMPKQWDMMDAQKKEILARTLYQVSSNDKIQQDMIINLSKYEHMLEMFDIEKEQAIQAINKTKAEIDKIKVDKKLTDYQASYFWLDKWLNRVDNNQQNLLKILDILVPF